MFVHAPCHSGNNFEIEPPTCAERLNRPRHNLIHANPMNPLPALLRAARLPAGLALLLLAASPVSACTIPVFRYALDRWHADSFRLEIPEAQLARLDPLLRPLRDNRNVNLRVLPVPDATESRLLSPANREQPVWAGNLDAQRLKALTTSPARLEILKRLVAGESAVWVLVNGGNRTADDAAAERITRRLKYLASIAALPAQDPFDPESRLGPGPKLRVAFSLLRVNPGDAAETHFIAMLTGPKTAELTTGKTPFIAPVFGRGRVLGTWPVGEVMDEDVDDLCLFLLGACSCQVKQQNPGWDLLMTADWDSELLAAARLAEAGEAALEPPKAAELIPAAPETVRIEGAVEQARATTPAATVQRDFSRDFLVLGSIIAAIFAGFLVWPGRHG